MSIDIELKNEVLSYGFPTIILDVEHARTFAVKFPGAIRFKYCGAWYDL